MKNDKKLYLSEFQGAQQCKCPRCRTGAMFQGRVISWKAQKMNTHCPHCNYKFEREPGYFYVAMFVSYAFNVAELVAVCVAAYILTGNLESPWMYLFVCLITAFVMAGFNYRYSRVVLMYWLSPGLNFNPDFYGDNIEKLRS